MRPQLDCIVVLRSLSVTFSILGGRVYVPHMVAAADCAATIRGQQLFEEIVYRNGTSYRLVFFTKQLSVQLP